MSKFYDGYFDGSAIPNPGKMQCGYVIIDLNTNQWISKGNKKLGHGTNNIAEYSGLIKLLEEALWQGIYHLMCLEKKIHSQINSHVFKRRI